MLRNSRHLNLNQIRGTFLKSSDNFSGPVSFLYERKVYLKDLNFVGF